jgi:hypothetical protein
MLNTIQVFIGTLAIIFGGAGGFLALLDWGLSDESKKWISDKAADTWLWLSYQRTWPLIAILQHRKAFTVLLACGMIFFCAFIVWAKSRSTDWVYTVAMSIIQILFGLLGMYTMRSLLRRAYIWITTTSNITILTLRAVGTLTIAAITLYVLGLLAEVMMRPAVGLTFDDLNKLPYLFFGLMVGAFVFSVVFQFFSLGLLATAVMCAYLVGVFALIGLFKLSQAIVLRVVEFEKGPILGMAALLAAFGSILNAFAKH